MSTHTPRPLQLISNSMTPGTTSDVFASPSPPSSFRHPKRFSMNAAISPSSSLSQTTAQVKAARRQSSIGYFPPDSTESPRRGSLVRRNSLGTLNEGTGLAGVSEGLWTKAGDRVDAPPLLTSSLSGLYSAPVTPGRERPPLTLTEKHADLLRFIAQKESKCLELRSQLAIHETELVQLKRKWERIVNRGLERDFHSAPTNGTSDAGSVVYEGIKEGVQGVSRLLAAGFSASPTSPASSSAAPKSQPKSRPPSLTHTLIRKSHSAKESNSSISTYATTTARLSQSSQSSLGDDPHGGSEEECRGIEGEGQNMGEGSHDNDDPSIQILMDQRLRTQQPSHSRSPSRFNDASAPAPAPTNLIEPLDGETWTSDVQSTATKAHRRKSRETARLNLEHLDFSTLAPSVLLSPPSMSYNSTSPGSSPRLGDSPSPSYFDGNVSGTSGSKTSPNPSGLAPMSSIPGLGLAAGVAVSPQSVGSWMDSMGKKLGQLQRSSTFTKNQKRASLLLADMSQSIVSVLAPPSSVAPGTNGSKLPTHLTAPSISPNSSVAGSLLDDEDDETVKIGAAVLQPVASPSVAAKERMTKGKVGKEKEDDDEEEWNW